MLERFLSDGHFTVDKNDEVRKVLGWMRGERKDRPIVLDGKHPYGILNKSAFMGSRIIDKAAVAKYTRPTPVPTLDAGFYEAIGKMSEALVAYLPVQDGNGKLAGHIDALTLLDEVTEGPNAAEMAHKVQTLRPDETIGSAIKAFRDSVSDHLPVVDDGKIIGEMPRQNIIGIEMNSLQSAGAGDYASETTHLTKDRVSDFMEPGALSVPAGSAYENVLRQLGDSGYVFVTEDGNDVDLLGVVTPEYAVRGVRRVSEAPQPGSLHGAGVGSRRQAGR